MLKRNQWYKLIEPEFINILRFIDKDTANNEKYIESLNRVADAYTKHKVLYVQLQHHCFPKDGIYNKFYAWHYRSSYSEYYCGQCLEYTDIVFDELSKPKLGHEYELKVIDDMMAGDDKLTAEQIRKRAEKLILNSVYGKYGPRPLAGFGLVDQDLNKKVPFNFSLGTDNENKEEKVMNIDKCVTIRSIIENYVNDCEKEYRAQYEAKVKLIKADDVIGDVAKQLQDIINKNRFERNMTVIGNELEEVIVYSKVTDAKLKAATSEFDDKIRNLHKVCREAENLCNLCDTYEEMRKVLADYEIIPNSKKRGK